MTRATASHTPGSSSYASREASPARDRWRTIRTITCELRALTGPAEPPGFGRPLAGPEVLVELPSFQGHMLRASAMPLARPVEHRVTPPRILAAPAPVRPGISGISAIFAWVAPLVLFAITGVLLGWLVALASS